MLLLLRLNVIYFQSLYFYWLRGLFACTNWLCIVSTSLWNVRAFFRLVFLLCVFVFACVCCMGYDTSAWTKMMMITYILFSPFWMLFANMIYTFTYTHRFQRRCDINTQRKMFIQRAAVKSRFYPLIWAWKKIHS